MKLLDKIFIPYNDRVDAFKFEEDALVPADCVCSGVAGETEIRLSGDYDVGDILHNPQTGENLLVQSVSDNGDILHNPQTGENLLVQSVSDKGVSVIRGYGGSSRAGSIKMHDRFVNVGIGV